MRRSDSAVSAYILKKETEAAPRERKRPTEVFGADPGHTGMRLSGGGGTHLLATVTAAEAQAAEPQRSAWPPPCHWGGGPQLGHNWLRSREVPSATVGCRALVLRVGMRGWAVPTHTAGEGQGSPGRRGRACVCQSHHSIYRQDFPAGTCKQ